MTQMIDSQWAWSRFEPSAEQPWTPTLAAHLLRRATFGATGDRLQQTVNDGPETTIDRLFNNTSEPADFRQQIQSLAAASLATGNPKQLSAWWAYRMLHTPAPLLEKMTLFWHGHFATSAEKVEDAELMLEQNQLLREHALGDFASLLLEISRDPAMLLYLDSATNRKAHPNENYAREIMELFCLGEGQYSETDIRELARCFTGWEVRRKKFRFNRYQHDNGEKTVLGQSGRLGGEDGVQIVVGQEAAATFIASKLVRYFVMDEPWPSAELVAPLARQLLDDDMNVATTVRRILTSNLFYSTHAVARKVKSPVELVIGFLRTLEGSTNTIAMAEALDQLGQGLFYPPSVKGWDGGRTWINSSTLLGRSNFIRRLLENEKTRFDRGSLTEYLASIDVKTPAQLIDFLQQSLFAVPIPTAARERILAVAADGSRDQRFLNTVHAVCTLPEFHLN
ncbi:MAG: hypothetical protein Fues2KO_27000 [Fuerstiella sp.]